MNICTICERNSTSAIHLRIDVERAIGLLKCKFRRLKYLNMLVELEMLLVIFACCVLHNFILLQESDTEPEVDTFDQIDIYAPEAVGNGQAHREAEEKRRAIALEL
ncbi:hypothetical protein DPMN_026305 [Dreissena polymorpha]|nr:hypothetical protein DPMN_026301 [Dreissena polymorpha]KAH3863320.1 hypothetical protein DPMN_026303 [Dreissena polymorpha]KAH3863322.1 hypothetical protein DPMN_026305 [Dreissena polymorpha]